MKKFYALIILTLLVSCAYAQFGPTIGSGYNFSYALDENGNLYTWGDNLYNQLGHSETPSTSPNLVPSLLPITSVSGENGEHVLALTCNGNVLSWGNDFYGQLGHASIDVSFVLSGTQDGGGSSGQLNNVTSVETGGSASYALLSSGEVMAWGKGSNGALGNNDNTFSNQNTPVYVLDETLNRLDNIIQISGFWQDACIALDNQGQLWSWGYNNNYQLGQKTTDSTYLVAHLVKDPDGTPYKGFKKIATGSNHTLLLDNDNTLWSFGGNWAGQLGIGETFSMPSRYLTKVNAGEASSLLGTTYLTNVISFDAGQSHSLAVIEIEGERYTLSWGGYSAQQGNWTTYGQLGRGASTFENLLTPGFVFENDNIDTLKNVVAVSAGGGTSVFEIYDGQNHSFMICGGNAQGQQVNGTNLDNFYPAPLSLPTAFATPCASSNGLNGKTNIEICFGEMITYNHPSSGLNLDYSWSYEGWTSPSSSGGSTTFSVPGTYIVSIEDTRSTEICSGCPTVVDTIEVSYYQPDFDVVPAEFCEGVDVTFQIQNATGNYQWFSDAALTQEVTNFVFDMGTTETLDMSILAGEEIVEDTAYAMFVVDNSTSVETLISNDPCTPMMEFTPTATGIQVENGTFTLSDLSFYGGGFGGGISAEYTLTVYANKNPFGDNVPDSETILATFSETLTSSSSPGLVTMTPNLELSVSPGSIIWLEITGPSSSFYSFNGCNRSTNPNLLSSDNFEIVGVAAYSHQTFPSLVDHFGTIFNINFGSGSNFECPAAVVLAERKCAPCNAPDEVTIVGGDIMTCVGESVSLEPFVDLNANQPTYQFFYSWFWIEEGEEPVELISGITSMTPVTASSSEAEEGVNVLVVEDRSVFFPAYRPECMTTDTINFRADICTGQENLNEMTEIVASPNPFNNQLEIQWTGQGTLLEILNNQGQIVESRSIAGTQSFQWHPNLPAGIYHVRVSGENIVHYQRVTKH